MKLAIIKFIEKIQPRDIIAVIVLLCCFFLKLKGIDGKLDVVIALIIGYYFSKRVFEEKNRE